MTNPRRPAPATGKPEWLKCLEDAYALAGWIISERIGGRKPVCEPGCCACCLSMSVPVTDLELRGILRYIAGMPDQAGRDAIHARLRTRNAGDECPFLLSGRCGIYMMRPLSCRRLIVFGEQCGLDEDVHGTRPEDVLMLTGDRCNDVSALILRGMDYGDEHECSRLAREAILPGLARDLTSLPLWDMIAGDAGRQEKNPEFFRQD